MSAAGSDTWVDAPEIGLGASSDVTSNDALSVETDEPYEGEGLTAWWKFTATGTGWVGFDTAQSTPNPIDADTLIQVFTGSSVDALTLVASPTDGWGSDDDSLDGFTTRVAIHVEAGTTYFIQVDAYDSGVGYVLRCQSLDVVVLRPAGDVRSSNVDPHMYTTPPLPPTIVGTGAVCSDDSDSTYAELSVTSSNPSSTGSAITGQAAMFMLPARPDIFMVEKIRIRAAALDENFSFLQTVWSWATRPEGTSSAGVQYFGDTGVGSTPGWIDTSTDPLVSEHLHDPSDDLLAYGSLEYPPAQILADGDCGFVVLSFPPLMPAVDGTENTTTVRLYEVEFHVLVRVLGGGVLKVWSVEDEEWLWQGHGSVSGATGVGRFKVRTEDGWEIAEPVAGEGGAGRLKVWNGSGWQITSTVSA